MKGGIPVALPLVITKAQVKDIRALATAKGRAAQGAFLAEGDKLAREWLASQAGIRYVIAVPGWTEANHALISRHPEAHTMTVTEDELARISTQQTPNGALVIPAIPSPPASLPGNEWCLVLDSVQDPGNVGAIIRIADWFGVKHVVCSPGCADYYNPKVVAAGMGGHLRVALHTSMLAPYLESFGMPVLAATLGGASMHSLRRQEAAALVIGNESKGISEEVLRFATQAVTIPKRGGAESLNAAVAAGILLAALGPA